MGPPKGAVVVLQEIFGLNAHIRAVTDRLAMRGYLAVAPSTFARVQKGVDLGYSDADMQQGRQLKAQRIDLGQEEALTYGGHLVLPPLGRRDDEEGSYRLLIGAGIPAARAQRRVVGQAQVIAKPDQPHDFLLPRPLKPRAAGLSAITSARVARQP